MPNVSNCFNRWLLKHHGTQQNPSEIGVSSNCLHLALWPFSDVTLESGNYMLVYLCVPVSPLPSYEPPPFSSSCGANFSYTYTSNQKYGNEHQHVSHEWMWKKKHEWKERKYLFGLTKSPDRNRKEWYDTIVSFTARFHHDHDPKQAPWRTQNVKRQIAFHRKCNACSFLPSTFSQHQ